VQFHRRRVVERKAPQSLDEIPGRNPAGPIRRIEQEKLRRDRQRRNGLPAFSAPMVEPGP
jgi:hypothetical protein